jgi:hypothetical protein
VNASRLQRLDYHRFDSNPLFEHIIVPKPKHPESKTLEVARPFRIVFLLFGVLPTVEFQNEPSFQTNEIGDVIADRMLPAEAISSKLLFSYALPNEPLGISHVRAEFAGEVAQGMFHGN